MPSEPLNRRDAKRAVASAATHIFRAAEDMEHLYELFAAEGNPLATSFAQAGNALCQFISVLEDLWAEAWGPPPQNWMSYH
jgi:hypothetical protein